ncbi:MAG TPA: LysR family transcriptional regulator [Polyangiaceae bacterium]|nr:LysR family transcriptional regulator [Polyangiaceae bacterium]
MAGQLNYHHLRYFYAIAKAKSMRQAAEQLRVSPPALSAQLKQLETLLGHQLIERAPSGPTLTEAGRIAFDYAETIFRAGDELQDVMTHGLTRGRRVVRVGAVATLSRNFLIGAFEPLLARSDIGLVVRSGSLSDLLTLMQEHEIDIVLSNQPAPGGTRVSFHSRLLAEQPVSLVGGVHWKRREFRFPEDCAAVALTLPGPGSNLRAAFDAAMDEAGIRPLVAAEVDDMAMLRLLAQETEGLTLVPRIVVKDELERNSLIEKRRLPRFNETFYAISPSRRFPNPLVRELVEHVATRG